MRRKKNQQYDERKLVSYHQQTLPQPKLSVRRSTVCSSQVVRPSARLPARHVSNLLLARLVVVGVGVGDVVVVAIVVVSAVISLGRRC